MRNKKKMKWIIITSFVLATLLSFIPSVGAAATYNPTQTDYATTEAPMKKTSNISESICSTITEKIPIR